MLLTEDDPLIDAHQSVSWNHRLLDTNVVMNFFDSIPIEIAVEILLFCSLQSLGRLRQCSIILNKSINIALLFTWIESRIKIPGRRDTLSEGDVRHLARVADGIRKTSVWEMKHNPDSFNEISSPSDQPVIKMRGSIYLTPNGKLFDNSNYYSIGSKIIDFIHVNDGNCVDILDGNGDFWRMNLRTNEPLIKLDTGVSRIVYGGTTIMISKKNGETYLHGDKRTNFPEFRGSTSIHFWGQYGLFIKDGMISFMENSLTQVGISGMVPNVTNAIFGVIMNVVCVYTTTEGVFIIAFDGHEESAISSVGTLFIEMPEINTRVYQVGDIKNVVQMERCSSTIFNNSDFVLLRTIGGEVYMISRDEYRPKKIDNINNALWIDNKTKKIITLK